MNDILNRLLNIQANRMVNPVRIAVQIVNMYFAILKFLGRSTITANGKGLGKVAILL